MCLFYTEVSAITVQHKLNISRQYHAISGKKISIIVGHKNKSISYKTWKVVLFPHAVQVRASAMCRFDRGASTEERLIRTLENMTYEKRRKEYLLLSLTEIRLSTVSAFNCMKGCC